jgi:ribose-phosphate pyrophosphokinase
MTLILGFQDYLPQAEKLASCLSIPIKQVDLHQFPDGETKVTLPEKLPKNIIICRSLNQPNEKLIELIITASAARNQGVEYITLVAPYLCYMRQDKAFSTGEAISQKIVGKLLSEYFDSVITIDPHLHRIKNLTDAIPNTTAITLHATDAITHFLQSKFQQPIIIGPDEESEQWVKAIAAPHQWQYTIATKQRYSDTKVNVSFSSGDSPEQKKLNLTAQDIIIVDDIASTGKTLEEAVIQIKKQNPNSISIIVTHAFFVDSAIQHLNRLGVNNIWSSDSIPHPSNAFSIINTVAIQLNKHGTK